MLAWLLWLFFITFHGIFTVQMYHGVPSTMNCAIYGAGHTGINIKSLFQHRSWWWHHEWTKKKKSDCETSRVTPLGYVQYQGTSELLSVVSLDRTTWKVRAVSWRLFRTLKARRGSRFPKVTVIFFHPQRSDSVIHTILPTPEL